MYILVTEMHWRDWSVKFTSKYTNKIDKHGALIDGIKLYREVCKISYGYIWPATHGAHWQETSSHYS